METCGILDCKERSTVIRLINGMWIRFCVNHDPSDNRKYQTPYRSSRPFNECCEGGEKSYGKCHGCLM